VQNPRKAGSLERGQPLSPYAKPLEPRSEVERREYFRPKGQEGQDREAGPKAVEEKALKGRIPGGQGSAAPVLRDGGWVGPLPDPS
jgi:hypothetical protein